MPRIGGIWVKMGWSAMRRQGRDQTLALRGDVVIERHLVIHGRSDDVPFDRDLKVNRRCD